MGKEKNKKIKINKLVLNDELNSTTPEQDVENCNNDEATSNVVSISLTVLSNFLQEEHKKLFNKLNS